MYKNKFFAVFISLSITLMIFTGCSNVKYSDASSNEHSSSESLYADVIEKDEVISFSINISDENWQNLLNNATDKEYVSADVIINGTEVKNVGIRAKGNSSLSTVSSSDSDRYSFKIKFDEYIDDQTYMGLDQLVINNCWSDNSYMKEYLSYDIMNYIGVKTPVYAFADIIVNGETWGLYLLIEDYEDSYLNRTYDGEGVIYKPDSSDMAAGDMKMKKDDF